MSRRYAVEPKRELSTSPSLSLNTVIDLSLLLFNLLIRIRSTVTSYEIFCASKKTSTVPLWKQTANFFMA
jgi:hypothetical protein